MKTAINSKENVMDVREILRSMKNDPNTEAIWKKYGKGKRAEEKLRKYIKDKYAPVMTRENGFEREELCGFLFVERDLDISCFPHDLDRSIVRLCKIDSTVYFFSDEGFPLFKMEEYNPKHSEAERQRD